MATQADTRANVPLSHPDMLYINGAWVAASKGGTIDVIAPATEKVYVKVAEAGEEDINRAVAAARDAFDNGPWPLMSHAERAGYIRRLAGALTERAESIAKIWPNEMGILYSVSSACAAYAGAVYNNYADMAGTFAFEEEHVPHSGAKIGYLVHEPVGVVGVIIPWNGPIMIAAFSVAPALLSGCTVVVK